MQGWSGASKGGNSMVKTNVNLCGIELDNPIIPASGTFGYGYEFAELYDINVLGTFSFKGGSIFTSSEIASSGQALRHNTQPKQVFFIFLSGDLHEHNWRGE